MKICCPNCLTIYVIDGLDKQVLALELRCSTCGHVWHYNPTLTKKQAVKFPRTEILPPFHYKQYWLQQNRNYSQFHGNTAVNKEINRQYQSETNIEQFQTTQPVSPPIEPGIKSKSSISQCVFCRRSSKCNMHDLYSGRSH